MGPECRQLLQRIGDNVSVRRRHTISWYSLAEAASCRSFWTLSGSPSLMNHPSLLHLAKISQLSPPQAIYKLAQNEGIVPLSGTTDETHMRQDVEVENLSFAATDNTDALVEEVKEFMRE